MTFHVDCSEKPSYPDGFWTPYCRLHKKQTGSKCTKLHKVHGPLQSDKDAALKAAKLWLVAECYYPGRQWAHVRCVPKEFEVPDDVTLNLMGGDTQQMFEAPHFKLLRDDELDEREARAAGRAASAHDVDLSPRAERLA